MKSNLKIWKLSRVTYCNSVRKFHVICKKKCEIFIKSFILKNWRVLWTRFSFTVGHVLLTVNKAPVIGRQLEDGKDVMELLENPENYPLSLKFGRPKMTTNEKIFLASMFYPLFAIASQLSPEPGSSGIEVLEADTFKLHCFQTFTGVKFIIISEPHQTGMDALLRKIHELYADYALKNPFYSLEMPIRCELFESNLQALLEQVEKTGISNVWVE